MRLLNTLLVILTVGIASAQESELTISQISHGDHTYTHIKGDDNGAENCFTATSSMTLAMSVDGLSVDNIYINNEPFSWAGPGGEALAISFGDWDDYNRVYRNRGSQRPIRDTSTNLLYCGGWSLGADGQTYSNDAFEDYTYNSFPGASGTIGGYIYFQGTRIQFNGFAATRELLEDLIEDAIVDHMTPAPAGEWISTYNANRFPTTAYTNTEVSGYWYSVSQPLTGRWSVSVYSDAVDSFWGVPGTKVYENYPSYASSEQAAKDLAEATIAGLTSTLSLNNVNEFRYAVFPYGEGVFYTLVFNAGEELVSLERYASFNEAQNAGRSYAPTASETPTISTNGLCFASETAQNPIGFFVDNYITSSITENGVSRFDYVSASGHYDYRDINRTNSVNRFGIYPPTVIIASDQIKIISHRAASTIQPSDILASVGIAEDCSNLDGYLTTAVNNYRAAFDEEAGPVVVPEIVISGWESADAALPATYTNPAYPGWSYLLSRGTGNRSYIISDVMHTDGTRLQVNGPSASSTVVRLRDTAAFHRIGDAHAAARAAIANN